MQSYTIIYYSKKRNGYAADTRFSAYLGHSKVETVRPYTKMRIRKHFEEFFP